MAASTAAIPKVGSGWSLLRPGRSRLGRTSSISCSNTVWKQLKLEQRLLQVHPFVLKCSSREDVLSEESQEEDLEQELQEAIKSENYTKAAKLRDLLKKRQEDDVAGVLAANARFYRAFEECDVADMRRVWSKGDNVHCVHPGASCISGHELVMSSWEVMLLGPDLVLPLNIHLQELEVRVKGSMGFITCIEVVKTPGVTNWGKQIATNIFEKQEDGVWRICMHHASYVGGGGSGSGK